MTAVLFLAFTVIATTAPDFELSNSKGKKVKLADYQNKVLVLTFSNKNTANLATVWSVPIYYKYKNSKDIAFLWISDMEGIPKLVYVLYRKALNESAEKLGIPYPLLDWAGKISKRYRMSKEWPLAVLVGKDGNIKWKNEIRSPVEPIEKLESLLRNVLH